MARDLRGRSIVVTGASSGIGFALARLLAAAGARLVLAARREERLRALAEECTRLGGEAIPWPTDVTVRRHVELAVGAAVERFGAVDAIVNNAGRGHFGSVETLEVERLREMLETNFLSALYGAQAALPFMKARGQGHIVFVGSIVGKRAPPAMSAYAAAKAAVVSLAESLRVELAGSGIDVTLVLPASTATEFHDVASGEERRGRAGYVQSAEAVARSIVRAIVRPRREVYPSPGTHLFAVANEVAPGLIDWIMRRALGRRT